MIILFKKQALEAEIASLEMDYYMLIKELQATEEPSLKLLNKIHDKKKQIRNKNKKLNKVLGRYADMLMNSMVGNNRDPNYVYNTLIGRIKKNDYREIDYYG
jgi:septal ring factor EnvC (AmiA/AmiB activator)